MSGLSREMIIHPGETLKEILEEREMSQQELALRAGVTPKHVSTVLNGEKNISVSFAKKLEYALNIDAEFWMNLQTQYDKELIEFDELHSISKEEICVFDKLKNIFSYIVKNGFVESVKQTEQQILELRKYFSVSNLTAIPSIVTSGAFRAQSAVNYDPYVLFGWLKICESLSQNIEAEVIPQEKQAEKLLSLCPRLKSLSLLPQNEFIPLLRDYFSSCGIAFVVAPAFKGAPVQGFIKTEQDGKTIVCMTFRQKRADIFWFTLFHEIAHFINGDSKQKFIDFESVENAREKKADKFAQNMLIDSEGYENFISEDVFSLASISDFAKSQKVSASIVIGRLQNDGVVSWQAYSDVIDKYEM
ncbi:MAG: HigA family addiction module antitoxin [Treponema sp.]|nr:HigA family addiction module antitoxin [Treponema sp.]